jgi:hypothetical protein
VFSAVCVVVLTTALGAGATASARVQTTTRSCRPPEDLQRTGYPVSRLHVRDLKKVRRATACVVADRAAFLDVATRLAQAQMFHKRLRVEGKNWNDGTWTAHYQNLPHPHALARLRVSLRKGDQLIRFIVVVRVNS